MRPIHRWQHQYLGTTTLPRSLGAAELQAFFLFSEAQLEKVRTRRTPPMRIAGAIQLGFLRMTGALLADFHSVPARLMRFVAAQLALDPIPITTLRSVYDRPKTRYEHQWWAMQVLGFRKAETTKLSQLGAFLAREAITSPGTDYLVGRGKAWLYQHGYLALATRDLRDLAVRAMSLSETGLLHLIHARAARSSTFARQPKSSARLTAANTRARCSSSSKRSATCRGRSTTCRRSTSKRMKRWHA